ncbi:MAG: antitoxin VapB family protein [Candidatus Bathyarchaeia archaeon]
MKRRWIAVSREVYEALRLLGRFGESFDDVIRRLLNQLGIPVEDRVRK